MRAAYLILLLLLGACIVQAQHHHYSRVYVPLNPQQTIQQIAGLGIDVTHGDLHLQKSFETDLSDLEISWLQAAGIEYEVRIEDVVGFYVEQNQHPAQELLDRTFDCFTTEMPFGDFEDPENFQLGSMGGFYTYQEMLDILDDMASQYPNLISPRTPIDGFLTHEENPIYWLRISDNPGQDEAEPEALYTALHHAREPNSLSQLIYFMWYLLENYDSDPDIKYLIDEVELYFVPCVNPDGYLYNEFTNPEGGGLWRKNRRPNFDGSVGVDLNRNYGFGWGVDNSGSSPNPESQVYRGPEAFSEPETQAMQAFCNAHAFQLALNYHTYGNLLIYPWGYLDTPTADSATFASIATTIAGNNSFFIGTATETVGYNVNGVSDDWMYGENITKPAIYSMTPEVGVSFWPPASAINFECRSTLLQNLRLGFILLNFGQLTDLSSYNLTGFTGTLPYSLQKIGLQPGTLEVSLTGLNPEILSTGMPQSFDLSQNESDEGAISYTLSTDTPFGTELQFLLSVSNGEHTWSDTLTKLFLGPGTVVFEDTFNDLSNWEFTGNWDLTSQHFYSGPTSYTDSPNGNYPNNDLNVVATNAINLELADNAVLSFFARWEIESDYDYLQISAVNTETGNSTTLCGRYANPGVGNFQPTDEPLYDGTQNEWILEQIDLTEFVGQSIAFVFELVSDEGLRRDGFYLDDLKVTLYEEDSLSTSIYPVIQSEISMAISPNPANEEVRLFLRGLAQNSDTNASLELRNALGQVVRTWPWQQNREQTLPLNDLPKGLYFLQWIGSQQRSKATRLILN